MTSTSLFLTTPRLALREFQLADWRAVLAWAGDPAVVAPMAVEPFDAVAAKAYVARMVASQLVRPRRRWEVAIIERRSGQMIGACGLNNQVTTATLGYALARDCWGAGYATEAAIAVLSHGFERLALTRVVASCPAGHAQSARVLTKLGFARRPPRWWERWWGGALWRFEMAAPVWTHRSLRHLDGTGTGPAWQISNASAPMSISGSTPMLLP